MQFWMSFFLMSTDTLLPSLERALENELSRIVLLAPGKRPASGADLLKTVREAVFYLRELGIGPDDRVAIVLPNGPEMAAACLSVMSASVAVPCNPDYRREEFNAIFDRLKPRLLITLAEQDHPSREAAESRGIPVCELRSPADAPAGSFRLSSSLEKAPLALDIPGAPQSTALILQTSGTTALPKYVPLTHRNLICASEHVQSSLRLGPGDRVLHFLPMFHIGGIVDVLLAPILAGGSVICASAFSTRDFFRDLEEFLPTWTQAVPAMIHEILSDRGALTGAASLRNLRFLRSVSAPLPASTLEEFERVFGIPVIEIFGMTETAGVITSNPLPPEKRKAGSVGIEIGSRVVILDAEDRPLKPGETGQVVVTGPSLTAGYLDAPEENARALSPAGLRTGDLGHLDDDGFLFLTGRAKDIINRGGEKVTPQEIDRLLLEHPAVMDAAAFPVPHPVLGEEVGALVVMSPGVDFVRSDLLDFLRERLAFFKIPRFLEAVSAIPRHNGKLQRATLSALLSFDEAVASGPVEYRPPTSPVAKILAPIWERILKPDHEIGIDDDFFLLGGDSLTASSFVNELQQRWGETVYVSSLFDFPTVSAYEAYLQRHYPSMVARMLGESLAPHREEGSAISSAMIAQVRESFARPNLAGEAGQAKLRPAIFVLSAPRSGSTLLRAMLGGNPGLFSPPELYLLPFDNLEERKERYSGSLQFQLEGNLRALMELRGESVEKAREFMAALEERNCSTREYYSLLQDYLNERILVDKTPDYAGSVSTLQRAEQFFESPCYVHLVRHPYGMIRSFEEAKLEQLWYPRFLGKDALGVDDLPFTRRQFAEMVWLILNENILEFLSKIPAERQFKIRFEDLVNYPEQEMRSFCEKFALNYDPGMIHPQSNKKQRMTDGIYESSRMIGDPKFHLHRGIEANAAELWKSAFTSDFLADETFALAAKMGYSEKVAHAHGREEFEL